MDFIQFVDLMRIPQKFIQRSQRFNSYDLSILKRGGQRAQLCIGSCLLHKYNMYI